MKTIDINTLEALYAICAMEQDNPYNRITELKRRAERYNGIVNSLSEATRPLRCKEIAAELPKEVYRYSNGREYECPVLWQAVSATLKNMLRDGMVERVRIGTEIIRGHIEVPIYGYRLAAVEG